MYVVDGCRNIPASVGAIRLKKLLLLTLDFFFISIPQTIAGGEPVKKII